MFDEKMFRDVHVWISSRSRTQSMVTEMSNELWEHVNKNCILVPGPDVTKVWYHPGRSSFYKVKSENTLVCAHRTIFGAVSSPGKGKRSDSGDCKANLSLLGQDDQFQHNHARFSVEQAQRLCFNWAVNLLSCTVGDSSWLVMSVGYLASFWPREALFPNLVDGASHVESALQLVPNRSADEKRRFLEVFTVDNLAKFCVVIRESSAFRDVPLNDRDQWATFSKVVSDLVVGALNWQHPPSNYRNQQTSPINALQNAEKSLTNDSQVAQEASTVTISTGESSIDRPSTSQTVHQTASACSNDQPGQSAETSILSLPSGVEADESDIAEAEPAANRVSRRRKGARRRIRLTPFPRKFRSKSAQGRATKKPSPQKPQTDETKSVPSDNVQAISATMSPVVVLHRMSTRSLDKLKEQDGVIRLAELGDEVDDNQTVDNEKSPDAESSVGSSRSSSKRNQPDGETPVKRRRTDVSPEVPDNQEKENPLEGSSRTNGIISKSSMRKKSISPIKPASKTEVARKKIPVEGSIISDKSSVAEIDEAADEQERGSESTSVIETSVSERGSHTSNGGDSVKERSFDEVADLPDDFPQGQTCQVFGSQSIAGQVVDGQYEVALSQLPPDFRNVHLGMTLLTRIVSKRHEYFKPSLKKLYAWIDKLAAESAVDVGVLYYYDNSTNSVPKELEALQKKIHEGNIKGVTDPMIVHGIKWDIPEDTKCYGAYVMDRAIVSSSYLPSNNQEVLMAFIKFKEGVDRQSILAGFRRWFDKVKTKTYISKPMYSAFWPRT